MKLENLDAKLRSRILQQVADEDRVKSENTRSNPVLECPDSMITTHCKTCGSDFQSYESQKAKFCSPRCAYNDKDRIKHIVKKDRGTRICLHCKKEFQVHTGAPNAKCCSRQCNGSMIGTLALNRTPRPNKHIITFSCKICGNTFEATRKSERIYCSRKCQLKDPELKKRRVESFNSKIHPNSYSRTRKGWVEVGGKRFFARSSWEANYGRFLQFQKEQGIILDWDHEPDTFWFEGIKRGVMSFLPDFKVTTTSGIEYHEVKGWMDSRSKTKIKRMAKYHPEVRLIVIDQYRYKSISNSVSKIIPGWKLLNKK